jgi:hypothetical protein
MAAHERGTDDTDEEQRQIRGGGSFRHSAIPPFRHWGGSKAMRRIQSDLPFFIIFYQWYQCDPWSLSSFAAE